MERDSQKLAPDLEEAIRLAQEKLNSLPITRSESSAIIVTQDDPHPHKAFFERVIDENGNSHYRFTTLE